MLQFISWHFGLPSPVSQVIIGSLDTADPKVIASQLVERLSEFRNAAAQPRFGLATQLFHRSSKVVLVLQDTSIEIDPTPRRLDLNGQAYLSGRLLGSLEDPRILITDSLGQRETQSFLGGKGFQTILRCGSRKGSIEVKIHGVENGVDKVVANFPVACGMDLSTSVSLTPAEQAPMNIAQAERKIAEGINAERTAADLEPIIWDDTVAGIARQISEIRRDAAQSDHRVSVDILQLLKRERVATRLVLENKGNAPTPEEAHSQFSRSPGHRSSYMNQDATHVGIGIAEGIDNAGHRAAYLTELFIKKLPPVDPQAIREKLHLLVAQKRADALAPKMARDPVLEDVAQKYAMALAAFSGTIPKARSFELLTGLRRGYRALDVLAGSKADPLELGDQPEIVGRGKRLGIGVAEEAHPLSNGNSVYTVILIGTRR